MNLPLDPEVLEEVSPPPGSLVRLYYPLALSWLFMSIEMPVAVAIISRLPGGEVAAAGLLVMMGLALWIESPIIDLLATSTTLASTKRRYEAIRQFSLWLVLAVTLVHALFALTGIYGWVTKSVMRVPVNVAEATQIGFLIMIPWSGLIGWRRFLQGLLIRGGDTRAIGKGTFLRVAMICLIGFLLKAVTPWPSLTIVAIALIVGVTSESLYIHVASRPIVRKILETTSHANEETLTFRQLAKFHFPLTASTMVTIVSMPVLATALAMAPQPVVTMAAWQVAASVMFLFRSVTFALTEVVIARYRSPIESKKLFAFCAVVGALSSLLVLIFAWSGLASWTFGGVLAAKSDVAALAVVAFVCTAAVPFLNAMCSYNKGVLTQHHKTVGRLSAILVAFATMAIVLMIGIRLRWSGVVTGAVATTAGQAAELAVLAFAWAMHRRQKWPKSIPSDDQSLAQNISPAGSEMTAALRTASALRSPSSGDINPSSCSIDKTES